MTTSLWWDFSPAVTGALAALCFYIGSMGVPDDRISDDGVTQFEVNRRRRQLFANLAGILFMAATSALTLYLVLGAGT